jgi:NADPH-dependent glutamate synthase beta subunit-like oxidoreductase/Pyruvate/2-oxoacid:ferredoxin oxidoreductase delta subunit
MPALVNKTGDWRFATPGRREKTSPCTASCPLHNGIAAWVEKIRDGDFDGAWAVMSEFNPFPAITGHVCYHYCEDDCSRGQYDEAVAVGELEKQVGLWRHKNLFAGSAPRVRSKLTHSVAVVGAGPAGLACAYYLGMLGVKVTVYEKQPVVGGMLALGIPEYRLPRDVLTKELSMLRALGVTFKTGTELGPDISLDDLRKAYHAVFLATGAALEKKLNIPGEDKPGVMGALEYLRAVHLGTDAPNHNSVLVIGGGNAAIDAACVARLRGAQVVLAYRRTKEAMPAHSDEVSAAEEAGVQFLYQVAPAEILGTGRVQQVRLVRTEADRREEKVRLISNSAFSLDCDLVLVATGQEADLAIIEGSLDVTAASSLTERADVFVGGDLVTGPANVAAAIAAGREGARAIANFLKIDMPNDRGAVFAPPYAEAVPTIEYSSLNPYIYPKQGRSARPETEAGRCLTCGHCNHCGICWTFCPDLAIAEQELEFNFLLDYCKGCGICVKECPGGVLEMEVGKDGTEDHHG